MEGSLLGVFPCLAGTRQGHAWDMWDSSQAVLPALCPHAPFGGHWAPHPGEPLLLKGLMELMEYGAPMSLCTIWSH